MPDVVIKGTTPTPCGCCGIAVITMSCRKRGGTATLIGFPEFTAPSTPPKKYLQSDASGQYEVCDWTLPDCAGVQHASNIGYLSGTCSFDPVTGVRTNGGSNHTFFGTSCPGSTPDAVRGGCADSPLFNFGGNFKFVDTQTTRDIVPLGVICTLTSNAGYIISNEDTEANAIVRLLNAHDWTGWVVVPTYCDYPDCCLAQWEQRISSFNFAYQESQWKVQASGLLPSTSYNVSVDIMRRVYETGDYALFATITGTATSGVDGTLEMSDDVPNEEGYQSYATNPVVARA